MGLINEFLDLIPKAKATEAEINKWGDIKLKSFYKAKEITNNLKKSQKIKKQPTEWEKIFANPVSDKWLISKIYKEFI